MVVVDLVAIRLALYEGWIEKSVPMAVAISEAVELAKHFGTEDSGRFVNGVLGRIVRSLQEESSGDNDSEG
jgi:N utilization substance protein B